MVNLIKPNSKSQVSQLETTAVWSLAEPAAVWSSDEPAAAWIFFIPLHRADGAKQKVVWGEGEGRGELN